MISGFKEPELTPVQYDFLKTIVFIFDGYPKTHEKQKQLIDLIKNYDTVRDHLIECYQKQLIDNINLALKPIIIIK